MTRQIGIWSCSIYLSHSVIMHALVLNGVAAFGSMSLLLITTVLACLWAALVHELAERPLLPLRQRLVQQGPAVAVMPGTE